MFASPRLFTRADPALRAPGALLAVWGIVKLVLAALLAYAIWRAYQSPDLILDLSALRLC